MSGTIKTNLSKFHKKFILFICFFECQAPMFLVYLNAKEEELPRFLGCCMEKKEDVDIPWYTEFFGISAGFLNEDYSKWSANQEKIRNIMNLLADTSDETLIMMRVMNQSKADENVYQKLKE